MSYFEEEYLHIDSEESIAVMQWLGLAKADDYRKGWEAFSELLEEEKNTLWLFDFQKGKVVDIKDQKWTTGEWIPSAMETLDETGLKKVAVILSKDIFNKVAVRVIMGALSQESEDTEIAYFDSKDDAMDWLMTPEEEGELEEEVSNF